MGAWADVDPEYDSINFSIDRLQSRMDSVSRQISSVIASGGDPSELEDRYDKFCDDMHELIEERHVIARRVFS